MENCISRRVYLEYTNRAATVQSAASQSSRNPGSYGQPLTEAPPLQFEVIQLQSPRVFPDPPRLEKTQIPKLIYSIFLRVLYNFCYDMNWDRLSHRILVHKFNLFPGHRRCQIENWVEQFRRQNLFPDASESELQERAKQLIMGYLI
jgi:hypothetical protein